MRFCVLRILNPSVPCLRRRPSGYSLLLLRPGQISVDELQRVLTARYGASFPGSIAVALGDPLSSLIYPLDVVVAAPDMVARHSPRLIVMFSFTATASLLRSLNFKRSLSDLDVTLLYPLSEDDPFVRAAVDVYHNQGDENDLVDTLRRIAVSRCTPRRYDLVLQAVNEIDNLQFLDDPDDPDSFYVMTSFILLEISRASTTRAKSLEIVAYLGRGQNSFGFGMHAGMFCVLYPFR
jgi:hypothetical protein